MLLFLKGQFLSIAVFIIADNAKMNRGEIFC